MKAEPEWYSLNIETDKDLLPIHDDVRWNAIMNAMHERQTRKEANYDIPRENVAMMEDKTNDAVLLAAMEEVGLDNPRALLKRYPFEMSGGMLQRMMVALALLSRAPFIIADEPTTDLDAIAQARILDLLADIVARRGLGLLLVTHDMGVVARLAHHVTVMENGRLVEHCDVNTLFSAPRHPLSQRLLAAHLALYGLEKTP